MYRRLMARLRGEGHVPSWIDLLNDPTIPEDKRQHAQRRVRLKQIKPLVSRRKGEALLESLEDRSQLRKLFELLNTTGNAVKQPSANIRDIIKAHKSGAIAIDVDHRGAPVTIDGVKSNHVVEAFTSADALIRTGFKVFDSQSGGIPEAAVMLLGADTGGFKSVLGIELSQNIARLKRRIGMYSLEMTRDEVIRRQTASVVEFDASKEMMEYIQAREAAKEKGAKELARIDAAQIERAKEIAVKFEDATKEWADFFHITCPAEEVDISWVLQQAEMSDREIILIDYVGLLAGLGGDDQWRAMSNVVRQCKIWANRTRKTVIILAQMRFVDGKPELKYSKAILDHCNNAWAWMHMNVNGRDYLCVHQMKARSQRKFPFVLRVFPEFSKITDIKDEADFEIARLAIEDMRSEKDPYKRYKKADNSNSNEEKGRRTIDLDDEEEYEEASRGGPKLNKGGLAGKKTKSYDVSGDDFRDTRSKVRDIARSMTDDYLQAQRRESARVKAISKLHTPDVMSLTLEEASAQAEEVINRWEEASAGNRIRVDQLAKEILGLTRTKELCNQVRKMQGDTAARRRLSPEELAVHKAQVELIKHATKKMKGKGSEFLSESDFYAVDDLTLTVERGEEPIADPSTLDTEWQRNAVAWADQPAITLPNSAKPMEKRWGTRPESEDALKQYNRKLKAYENSPNRNLRDHRIVLWPPRNGKIKDYHYLDDVQLDTVVNIASKLATKDSASILIDELITDVAQYVELMSPGVNRLRRKSRKHIMFSNDNFAKACSKLGIAK